jgi:cation diffusion facilitator family transporter
MNAAPKLPRAASWIWLSIAAAITTMGLKAGAAWVSGSVGLLSDAMESGVNLVAAVVTMFALRWSAAPPDAEHPYGHGKGELMAALLEGVLVLVAGVAIIAAAVDRFLHPSAMGSVGLGLVLSLIAAGINGAVGVTLLRVGKKARSTALEADGHHLLTDVWTSLAVVLGLGLVLLTGKIWLDPLCAILVAVLVLRTGYRILRSATGGLVDKQLGPTDQALVDGALAAFRTEGVNFSAIRTRQAGRHTFVHLTVRVPGDWSVHQAHALADRVESAVAAVLTEATVDTHVEPGEGPVAASE